MTRTSFSSAWQRFFDPKTYVPFLIGSVALGIVSNGAYALLTELFGSTPQRVLMIVVATLAVVALAVFVLSHRLAPPELQLALDKRQPEKRRGLIYLVSQKAPCLKAVGYHRPVLERCWLVCSRQTLAMAEELRQEIAALGVQVDEPQVVNDMNDPRGCHDVVDGIYRKLPEGWEPNDVIADYLGMNAHASVGTALACVATDRPLQYTLPIFDESRKPVGVADPIEVVIDWADRTEKPARSAE